MRKVKIRRWDDMAEEFGMYYPDSINTSPIFVTGMKNHCGKTITVDEYLCYDAWEFSEQMFEQLDDDCTESRKQDCIDFFEWWMNQPGEDISQGYDDWKSEW